MTDAPDALPPGAIAVIGMSCRLPGAETPEQFWDNLRAGRESITRFDADELAAMGVPKSVIDDPAFVPAKGVMPGADRFDAGLFGYSPREAASMDPQQRVFLECAWAALEHAGYAPGACPGAVGVFAGSILSSYLLQNVWPARDGTETSDIFQTALGNDPTFLATRVSYLMDLHGPSVSVGTACSTSLMAVHLACQSLLAHECDMALAGGVSIHLPLRGGYRYEDGGILSPDGHCRPFDAEARGTVSSDGAGVVTLKRLEQAIADGDHIHAVIRGSAANNDGGDKVGYTAPSVGAQAAVIGEALAIADVAPETVAMVEAHAAGTLLGDPIEVAALAEAFANSGGRCALGSVKSNIGHVDAAAGIAGFIKTVLALEHGIIPPTLHFQKPNAKIAFTGTPFYVNADAIPLNGHGGPARAGVSSFGIGGTNVHVVLEQAPARSAAPELCANPYELLLLSARTQEALDAATDGLAAHLDAYPDTDLHDAGHTLRTGRKAFGRRAALVAGDAAEAADMLRAGDAKALLRGAAPAGRQSVAFMFPGLGDHTPGMGWELYCAEPAFRAVLDECAEALRAHLGADIREHLYAGKDWRNPPPVEPQAATPDKIDLRAMLGRSKTGDSAPAEPDRTDLAQPATFAVELALAELLRSWGVEPEAMIGHSLGEFVAATLAGVFSRDDALAVVAARARLIQERVPAGVMLAAPADEATLAALMPEGASLAALNAPALSVASGPDDAIAELERRLEARGTPGQRLRSAHAYHSDMLTPIVAPLKEALARVTLNPPSIPYVSCLSGTWITAAQATDPDYWAQHLCRTVRFQPGLSTLMEDPNRVLIEVGPGQSLTSHATAERARVAGRTHTIAPTMRAAYGKQSEIATLLRGIGVAWIGGAEIDRARLLARPGARRTPLPAYPFERQRYWIDPPKPGEAAAKSAASGKNPDVGDWFYLPYWKPSAPAPAPEQTDMDWLILCDAQGAGAALAAAVRKAGGRAVTVLAGDGFDADGDAFTIDPAEPEDYRRLLDALEADGRTPQRIAHLWSLSRTANGRTTPDRFAAAQAAGFSSLLYLLQALCAAGLQSGAALYAVASELLDVGDGDALSPEKATLLGPVMVAAQEHPGLTCRCIDTDIGAGDVAACEALAAQILAEAESGRSETLVAYRNGRRWTHAYEAVSLPPPAAPAFRTGGVYLITGGLGGVAMIIARHLASAAQARLVLVGRSALPDRESWDGWLAGHPEDDATSARIRKVRELEALGAEVMAVSADVSDASAMRHALDRTEARFGALNGVVHAAGVVGVEAFREITQTQAEDADAQFTAKARGLMVLDEVLAGRDIDFCLLMSSLSAVLGGLGFAAYGAANLFMDAYARRKSREGGAPWIAVDWDSWKMADLQPVIAGLGASVSDYVMEPDEGVDACARILAGGLRGQVVVSSGDLNPRLRQWVDRAADSGAADAAGPAHERPNLRTDYVAPDGEIETALAAIWSDLFHISPIGAQDDFFELGGHSLLATQLNARISQKLGVDLSLATLLQAPTVAELAVAVVGAQMTGADPDMLDSLLAEIGDLSAADIAKLLEEQSEADAMAGGHD